MRPLPRIAATLTLAGLLLPSVALAREANRVPAAEPDGKAVNCLTLSQIRDTQVRSDGVIDFYTSGGKVYRNALPMSCPSLGFEQRYLHKSTLNQICSVDTITVLYGSPMMRGATCGLGQFQPVKLAQSH